MKVEFCEVISTDVNYLDSLRIRLLNNGDLHQFNIETNNRSPSAAISKYIEYLSHEKQNYWLIPNNPEIYDSIAAFSNLSEIDWGNSRKNKINVGDIVYIYASKPIQAITIKAEVIKTNFSHDELLDNDEEYGNLNDFNKPELYFRLKLLNFTNQESLNLENLQKHGLSGNIQSKRTLSNPLLKYILDNEMEGRKTSMSSTISSLNQILYGPPGTGKTYNTINKALEIIDNDFYQENRDSREVLKEKFEEYIKAGQIEFVTFHQSYGYEEFVEGIRARMTEKGIEYQIESGIFKKLSKNAKENYENSHKTSIQLSQEKSLQQKIEQFLNESLEEQAEFSKTKGGKFKITNLDEKKIEIFTEDPQCNGQSLELDIEEFYKILQSSNELTTSRRLAKEIFGISNQRQKDTYYFSLYKEFQKIKFNLSVQIESQETLKNYILIIDEINRGNISKIFGELITLIESSKRLGADEEIRLRLPYSNELFTVPQNLYIIGTMNTADRSIALLDTALRRRFDFTEMMPRSELLSDDCDGINLMFLFETINKRVEYLYDRDHAIGHAYLIGVNTKEKLDGVMRNKIIPLLQEYFYDDWEKIRMVLGGDFIEKFELKSDIFNEPNEDYLEESKYVYAIKNSFDYSKFNP